jgi:hypothetical protein
MATFRHEDICRLDVTMDDALPVRRIERVRYVNSQRQHSFNLYRSRRNPMLQSYPVEKLHGDERLTVLLVDVINRANVRVVQGRCGLGFALETGEGLRVPSNFLGQELEGDKTVQARVSAL